MSLVKRLKSIWSTSRIVPRGCSLGWPSGNASNLVAVAVLFWLAAGCTRVSPVVKIGLVAPFEGRHRSLGYDVIYSARLAIREANAAGGIGDYRVTLVALDDFGDPEIAAESAASLVIDPGVVAAVGHWLPETSAAADSIYRDGDLPFVEAGEEPLGAFDPQALPEDFLRAYAAVTPFDEEAGPHAGSGYDALRLILTAMAIAWEEEGAIDRQGVADALMELRYDGLTGVVFQP